MYLRIPECCLGREHPLSLFADTSGLGPTCPLYTHVPSKNPLTRMVPMPHRLFTAWAGPEPGSLLQSSGTFPLSPKAGPGHLVTEPQILQRGAGRMFAVLGGGEIWSPSLAQLRPLE